MNKEIELITKLHQIGAIQFGEFQLKSGKSSPLYVNLRKIISYPDLLAYVANAMWAVTDHFQFDLICGVPYTALPIATAISIKYQIPMVMRRKEIKNYGSKQLIDGVFKTGQRCLIIEDVVTTGGSIVETAEDLKKAGLEVTGIIALIDREQGGEKTLLEKYPYQSVLKLSSALQTLLDNTNLNAEEKHIVSKLLAERTVS